MPFGIHVLIENRAWDFKGHPVPIVGGVLFVVVCNRNRTGTGNTRKEKRRENEKEKEKRLRGEGKAKRGKKEEVEG